MGAVALLVVVAAAGLVADRLLDARGLLAGTAFAAGAVLAAGRVRRERLAVAVVAPPLVYALLALALAAWQGLARGVLQVGADAATQVVLGAPALVGGTLLALLIVLGRRRARR